MLQHIFERQQQINKAISNSIGSTYALSDEQLEKSANDYFEKGGKKAVIGETRTFGGKEYVKTDKGWRVKNKGNKKTDSKSQNKKETPRLGSEHDGKSHSEIRKLINENHEKHYNKEIPDKEYFANHHSLVAALNRTSESKKINEDWKKVQDEMAKKFDSASEKKEEKEESKDKKIFLDDVEISDDIKDWLKETYADVEDDNDYKISLGQAESLLKEMEEDGAEEETAALKKIVSKMKEGGHKHINF